MDYQTFGALQYIYTLNRSDSSPTASAIGETRRAYDTLITRLSRYLSVGQTGQLLHQSAHEMLECVKQHLDSCLLPGETQRPVVPLLVEQSVEEYMKRIDALRDPLTPFSQFAIGAQAFAAFLYEVREIWVVGPVPQRRDIPPNVLAEFNNYSAWKIGQSSRSGENDVFGLNALEQRRIEFLKNEVDALLDGQRQSIGTLGAIVNETKSELDETIQRLGVESETTRAKVSGMNQTLEASRQELEALLREVDASKANVKAFADAVRLEFGTDATKKLWKYRSYWSAASFWVSAGVIAAVITLPPYYALTHVEDVVNLLERISIAATHGTPSDGSAAQVTANAISRLVIVSAPLALYFWAIKLLVRFNTRSMMLMDDARQRHTTMDTYAHLVEKNKATIEERGLMLSALFRPLPGQGAENVDPPNFVEIINKKAE
ncbi:hypothetical protein [Agrobacterium sp. LAD9]|uniref:hypothetical protein n=1 Tax=Agrobacterium sp. LAD9 TaxID=2055153 RepID=UPI000D1F3468|nr:hypothetical protein [Agrobacterium sp. LAD9]